MRASTPGPVLVFECERCNKLLTPPVRLRLLRALGAFRVPRRGGAGPTRLSQTDDWAFQASKLGLVRCAECGRLVCRDCWDGRRRACKSCAFWAPLVAGPGRQVESVSAWHLFGPASSAALDPRLRRITGRRGPDVLRRRRSGRRGLAWRFALAAALLMLTFETGFLLIAGPHEAGLADVPAATSAGGGPTQLVLGATSDPAGTSPGSPGTGSSGGPSSTAGPTQPIAIAPGLRGEPSRAPAGTPRSGPFVTPRPGGTPTPAPTPGTTDTPTPGPIDTPTPTPLPTPQPTPPPTVAPLDVPVIACGATPNDGTTPYSVSCSVISGSYLAGDSFDWFMDGTDYGSSQSWPDIGDMSSHSVQLEVSRAGTSSVFSNTATGSAGAWP